MARLPRLDLPGVPQHVIQRGNNRLPCFLEDIDRQRYLMMLADALSLGECVLHAWVLMDNHVHLLITPRQTGATARLMQQLGRNYVGWFNARHGRTGTLWEGRYKACLVDSARYVLSCYRYIELNPVRACMVVDATSYPWSSCAGHCGLDTPRGITAHAAYIALGASPEERATAYRQLLGTPLSDDDLADIRLYLQQQRALGDRDFHAMVEAKTQRFARARPAHRPSRITGSGSLLVSPPCDKAQISTRQRDAHGPATANLPMPGGQK